MSDSSVHEEPEEIEQENTVKYFILAQVNFFFFVKIEIGSNFTLNIQGCNANEEGLLRSKLNFLSYLLRIKLLDVKEK